MHGWESALSTHRMGPSFRCSSSLSATSLSTPVPTLTAELFSSEATGGRRRGRVGGELENEFLRGKLLRRLEQRGDMVVVM